MTSKNGVVLLPAFPPPPSHEHGTHAVLGTLLAELLDVPFLGDFDPQRHQGPLYFVPGDTLPEELAHRLNIRRPDDLFGGVVEQPFVATKAITHGLVGPGAQAPAGWAGSFAQQAESAILIGFTTFTVADAREAGHRLLARGPLRIKPVRARAGRGQQVVKNAAELDRYLSQVASDDELANWGLVLEENLYRVRTYSVGQVQVGGLLASYHGTQQLTRDHDGVEVYGGSSLTLVRGDYDRLLELPLPQETRLAVDQARLYDTLAHACYPSLVTSRRNYDVAQGVNAAGQFRSGVLEQSWRVGGASGAELLALRAFAANPRLQRLCARTVEVFGDPQLPDGATLLYRGRDEQVGLITKFASTHSYDSQK